MFRSAAFLGRERTLACMTIPLSDTNGGRPETQWVAGIKKTEIIGQRVFLNPVSGEFEHQVEFLSSPAHNTARKRTKKMKKRG